MKKKSVTRKKASQPAKSSKAINGKAVKAASSSKRASAHDKTRSVKPFSVVGIGASAGGMEAFTKFLQNLPADLDLAYVYIQHLSADHQSFLTEILQRKTAMKVTTVEDNMPVEKNNIYVIPANKTITIQDGILQVDKRARGELFHPIDHFLTSLAENYKENAIGIILSGTATDGTLGLKAIKAEGGICFAQDDTAGYVGMPHHAAEMGCVDFVMPPDKIAKELVSMISLPYSGHLETQNEFFVENKNSLKRIHAILHTKRNVDFSHYKETTTNRRILRRMFLNKQKNLNAYADFLKENDPEINALYQDLLITVTNFFRDANLYEALSAKILPALLKNRRPTDPLRVWIPGCATGEEAVSVAILVLEYLGEKALSTSIQIFATDLNEKAIERARTGLYPKSGLQNVSPARLKKFFVKVDGHYQVVKAIREMIIYAPHNLLKDPPFSRMDIISCQNVLIYIEAIPQNKIMHGFHYALKSQGYLLLGKSESIGSATDLFEQATKEYKVYTKKAVTTPLHLDFPLKTFKSSFYQLDEQEENMEPSKEIDLEKETEKILLKHYVPASVLVNKDLEILRFRGSVSKYLEPANGKASLNLMKMLKEDIMFEMRTAIHRAKKENRTIRKEGLQLNADGQICELAIEIIPVKGNGKDPNFLIVFKESDFSAAVSNTDSPDRPSANDNKVRRIETLEKQLTEVRENMKIMSEEFEATREELQSANEEVISSNEELQSINEELETSKEELQSTNEELTTINEELQNRNDELQQANDYSQAVVETMHEPLIILNGDLRIQNANRAFYKTFLLSTEETEGNYFYDIAGQQWDIPELRKQLKLLQTKNIEFTNFRTTYSVGKNEKILLLTAQKLSIRGGKSSLILIAMDDITERELGEERLKANEERFRLLLHNAFDLITIISKDGTVSYESGSAEKILGYPAGERVGKNIFRDQIVHPDDLPAKKRAFMRAVSNPNEVVRTEFRLRHKNGSYRNMEAIYVNLLKNPRIQGIIANYHDISERRKLEKQRGEFAGSASREIKKPVEELNQLLKKMQKTFSSSKDEKISQLVKDLHNQLGKLTKTTKNLFD